VYAFSIFAVEDNAGNWQLATGNWQLAMTPLFLESVQVALNAQSS